jgi:E3 ubiquitin-protein ligase makorin
VCLERVLDKANVSERRFGLLPGCSHAFCLGCIKAWRASPQSAGRAAGQAAAEHTRTCPVCRTVSFFVVPSTVFPADEAEKALLLEQYRTRLAATPCRHFDRGAGTCPFGSSCFFGHALADGSAPAPPALRCIGDADGELRFVQPVRLGAFLG